MCGIGRGGEDKTGAALVSTATDGCASGKELAGPTFMIQACSDLQREMLDIGGSLLLMHSPKINVFQCTSECDIMSVEAVLDRQ